MSWTAHLPLAPILLPLAVGALLLLFDERQHRLKATISLASAFYLGAAALALLEGADAAAARVYTLGGWPAPFGIVLVVDRLSALMLALTAALGVAAIAFSTARWQRAGPRFHALAQFQLAGLNGAFLTGDLFNLFVFFELLLAASYGLALHGAGTARVRSSLHYIAVNLTASLLFLIGASLLYGVAGTLNMADLAARIPALPASDRGLAEAGAAILGVALLVKAAMWPLGFWLPSTYAAAAAPAAALFAILSKVGVYAVLRLWLLLFGAGGFGGELLVFGGMATLAFGIVGVLASQELSRLVGFALVVSSGTLLAAIGVGDAAVTGAALYYLAVSTLGAGAFFLLVELVERAREPGADVLAVSAAYLALDEGEGPEEEVGVAIPATMALLGLSFVCCALLLAGLPPLPGFVAKFALLAALLEPEPVPATAWALLALLSLSGLAALIAAGRAGVRIFWPAQPRSVPRVRLIEMAPVAALLGGCLALTVSAGPALRYLQDTAQALHSPRNYVESVLPPR